MPREARERNVRKISVGEQVTMYQRVGSAEIIRSLPPIRSPNDALAQSRKRRVRTLEHVQRIPKAGIEMYR
jgi:hypothetical protein